MDTVFNLIGCSALPLAEVYHEAIDWVYSPTISLMITRGGSTAGGNGFGTGGGGGAAGGGGDGGTVSGLHCRICKWRANEFSAHKSCDN